MLYTPRIRLLIATFLLLVLSNLSFGQEVNKPVLSSPNDAVFFSLEDIKKFHVEAVYMRYLWLQDADVLDAKVTSLTLNLISLNSVIKFPASIGGGYLLRVDGRDYAPRAEDRIRWLKTWESLRFDPNFNILITKDTAKLVELDAGKPAKVGVYRAGQLIETPVDKLLEGELARIRPKHINEENFKELRTLTGSEAPVVSFPYFLTRALTAIKDQGGSRTLLGGLYYDFRGIEESSDKATAEAALLRLLGVGDGGDLDKFFDRIPSDRRVAMWKSNVTGKARRVDLFAAQTLLTGSWVSISQDPEDGTGDSLFNAMKSLIKLNVAARELIHVSPNGLHGFALFDGKGALQREAPSKVVVADMFRDRNGANSPHSTRLQPAISCIACHWSKDASSGFKSLKNDVLTLRKRNGFAPLDDINLRGKDINEVQLRLEQLYQGDFSEKFISRARDDLSEAVLRSTGPWLGGKGDQTDVVLLASQRLIKRFNDYNYEPVSVQDALRELGINSPTKTHDALVLFNKLIPPSKVDDVTIQSLANGLEVDRFSWSVAYGFVSARMKRE